MRYISEVEFKKELSRLNDALAIAKDEKEKFKINEDIAYLKRQREESIRNEKYQAMNEGRR